MKTLYNLIVVSLLTTTLTSLADTEIVNGIEWTYTVSDGKASVGYALRQAIPISTSGDITIPTTLGNYPVTSIGDYAFHYCSGLTSVTIPSSVKSIGNNAFDYCSGLRSVTIPDSVTRIGSSAFKGCQSSFFDTSTIPGVVLVDGWAIGHYGTLSGNLELFSIRGIGDDVFFYCSGLRSVTIGNGVTSIGDYAFYGCSGLTSVSIPDSVTSIGDYAFHGCSGLTSVSIGNGVTSIGNYAFRHCSSLASVTIPSSVKSIGNNAFDYCSGLRSVTIPDSVTSIGDWAFYNCSGLTSVSIPDSVTSIGDYAFHCCSGLTSVTIPDSVTSIGGRAFASCSSLASVTIPDSVTSIGDDTFWNCSSLASVTIPDSVTSIGNDAFGGCSGLTSVSIPNSVTNIGNSAFYGCSCLTSVSIGNGVTSIGNDAFRGCSGLASVTIPDSVTSIGHGAFWGCKLSRITLNCALWLTLNMASIVDSVSCVDQLIHGTAFETKPKIKPTRNEVGWTHEMSCSRCLSVVEPQTAIPALGYYIRNVTARQLWPHRKVEVCYEIADDIGDVADAAASAVISASGFTHSAPTFSSTGSYPWTRATSVYKKEGFSCRSGNAGKDSSSSDITTTVSGATAVSFYWKVSSESRYDKLHFYVDGTEQVAAISGTKDWTQVSVNLDSSSSHTLKWSFTKNSSQNAGQDCGWIDNLNVTYADVEVTATTLYGDIGSSPGHHVVVWDFEADGIAINQSGMTFTVAYSSVSGASSAIAVNTSSTVKDGMNVSGTVNLGYSPFANGEAKIYVDNMLCFSSANSGVFAWQPLTTGSHTLKHVSGGYTWTRTVNVTGLATAGTPSPQPPTAADANISIGTTTKAFGVEGGSSSITTAGSGTWSATASVDWITIPAAIASRSAGLPVTYQVAASTEVEPRTGYIYVSGHVFTVTQAGVGATLDHNSAAFETDGGTGSFTVLAGAQSSWKVKSNVDWISVTTTSDDEGAVATAGTGEGVVRFTVAPWNEVSTRSGTITAAGCTFTVNQTGRPMKISGPDITSGISGLSASFDYQSHVLPITVNALASTGWKVEVGASWLSVVDGGGGHGGGNVTIAINENPSWLARVGMVRIGTETLTVNQAGRPPSALSFLISPLEATASVKGANAIIAVSATPDLPWTATSRANWLTIMPEVQKGAGNGNVVYSASPNPTMAARTGTIQLAAATGAGLPVKTHTVTQPAATAMISTGSHTFDAAGESFAVDVAVDDVVGWSVAESCDWLSVAGTTNRVGAGSVSLVAMENPTVDPRSATVTIAGHAFVATQRGRTVEVEYETRVFGPEGGSDKLDVHPDGNAVWTALPSDPSWITIWGDEGCEYDDDGNVIGMGDATIEYIVSEYVGDGTPRTAAISIGDQTIYITQREYDLSIDPSATRVGGNAGAGEIGVSAPLNAIWNAIATDPWFTIVSGTDSGTGGGKVLYTYTDNDTGEERTGKIIISGEAYTITQERRMVSVSARVEGGGGHVGGTGTYYVGSPVTLTATAEDGYEFVRWTLPDGSVATSATLPVVADVDKEVVASFRRIPVHDVNGETVLAGTSMTFTAPAPILDAAGTTKLVCAGTSRFPEKGASFTLVVTGDIAFEWDLWTTNYLVTVEQTPGGQVRDGGGSVATSVWLSAGSILNLTAVPDTGNSLFRWVVNGETLPTCSTRSTRLKITAPLTVSAIFGVFDDTLAAALDAPALAFTTGGDAEWLPVIDASAQTGYTSARSGAIEAESETWLDTTVVGSGTLTFRWRVDCEKDDGGGSTWDRLSVWVNGVEAARLDGTTDWQMVTLPISAPKTTIRWSFYRDDWDEPDASHENAAWVDGVTFTKEGE